MTHDQAADRSRQRYIRFAWATVSGWGARVVSIASTLIVVPLTSGYLGVGRYGVWMTVSSVIGWLAMTDLGMGNHLTTVIAHTTGTNKEQTARRETTAVFWALLGISGSVLLVAAAVFPFISWASVFNADELVSEPELASMVAVIGLLTIASVPLSMVYRVFDAYQEGWKVNAWVSVWGVLSLVTLVAAVRMKAGLPVLAAAMLGPQVAISALASLVVFAREKPYLLGGWSSVDGQAIINAARGGGWYFLVAIQSLFWISKDNLLISHLLGPEYVSSFSTGFRVYFSVMGLLGSRIGQSLWPAYAEAIGSGHWEWVRSAYRRSTLATLGGYGAVAATFTIFAAPLLKLWAGKALVTPAPVLWALAAEFTVLCWINLMGYLLIAAHRPKPIAITGLIGGCASLVLGTILGRSMGVVGVPVANTICLAVFVVIPLHRITREILFGGSARTEVPGIAHEVTGVN